ncbi:unnamed protein product [Arctia plantaginis]|uniref:Uncharacterized protein n=1 Tax=Arctia plantaginis TaxID=874455 RepID=A0A8S0ZFW7_ARCPL|nr:unnamed protein product [Arctia plantaginis]
MPRTSAISYAGDVGRVCHKALGCARVVEIYDTKLRSVNIITKYKGKQEEDGNKSQTGPDSRDGYVYLECGHLVSHSGAAPSGCVSDMRASYWVTSNEVSVAILYVH